MRTLVVGDVHGCVDELRALLSAAAVGPEDRVVLAGDLIAKGPDSRAVVQLAADWGFRAVRGNHDEYVLRIRRGEARRPAKREHEEVAQALSDEEARWLEALPLWLRLEDQNLLVVHGGMVPGLPVEAQRSEDLLNLRSIRPDGTGSKRMEDGVPWGSLWRGPEHVVYGHDALRGLQRHPFATGLDTGCVYGGALTGLLLPERRLISVRARRAYAATE